MQSGKQDHQSGFQAKAFKITVVSCFCLKSSSNWAKFSLFEILTMFHAIGPEFSKSGLIEVETRSDGL
jgi:hypothetical protein